MFVAGGELQAAAQCAWAAARTAAAARAPTACGRLLPLLALQGNLLMAACGLPSRLSASAAATCTTGSGCALPACRRALPAGWFGRLGPPSNDSACPGTSQPCAAALACLSLGPAGPHRPVCGGAAHGDRPRVCRHRWLPAGCLQYRQGAVTASGLCRPLMIMPPAPLLCGPCSGGRGQGGGLAAGGRQGGSGAGGPMLWAPPQQVGRPCAPHGSGAEVVLPASHWRCTASAAGALPPLSLQGGVGRSCPVHCCHCCWCRFGTAGKGGTTLTPPSGSLPRRPSMARWPPWWTTPQTGATRCRQGSATRRAPCASRCQVTCGPARVPFSLAAASPTTRADPCGVTMRQPCARGLVQWASTHAGAPGCRRASGWR